MISEATLRRGFKFGLVGGFGAVLNTAVLYLLADVFGVFYVFASFVATELAIISNFFGHNIFTFFDSTDTKPLWKRFGYFQGISVFTLVSTVSILSLLTHLFGQELLLLWNIIAIGITFLLNFFLNKRFTWALIGE